MFLRLPRVPAVILVMMAAGCFVKPDTSEPENAIRLGVLLPFTGDFSTTGVAAERALILAVEHVNAHGGVAGRPLVLLARDTRSNFQHGVSEGRGLLDQEQVQALFGPENDDVALALIPNLVAKGVVALSGSITSTMLSVAQDEGLFYRTVPSSRDLGRAIAVRALVDSRRKGAAVCVNNGYGGDLAKSVEQEFVRRGGTFAGTFTLDPDAQGFQQLLRDLEDTGADALFLITYPASGARVINEWSMLGGSGHWYLAPTLRNQVFLENIMPGSLDGVVGVVPRVVDAEDRFAKRYWERWSREQPQREAYFFFDALMAWALAAEVAAHENGGNLPSPRAVAARIGTVGAAPGERVSWDEWDRAKELVAGGRDVDLVGASGDLDFDGAGDVKGGDLLFWRVQDHAFVDE